MITARNQATFKRFNESLDNEEMMMLDRCLAKIKKHIDRNIENGTDQTQVSRMVSAKWFISENF